MRKRNQESKKREMEETRERIRDGRSREERSREEE